MPAHRDTVRRLATALGDYAQRFHDPHLASPRVKSDLAWAVSNRTDYVAPPETADSPRQGAAQRQEEVLNRFAAGSARVHAVTLRLPRDTFFRRDD